MLVWSRSIIPRKNYKTSKNLNSWTIRHACSSVMDITATPAINQHIRYGEKQYTTIKEGLAFILIPTNNAKVPQLSPSEGSQSQDVFYNPIQQFNRDLSVLVIKAYGNQFLELQKIKVREKEIKKTFGNGKDKKRKRNDEIVENETVSKSGRLEADEKTKAEKMSVKESLGFEDSPAKEPTKKLLVVDENYSLLKGDEDQHVNSDLHAKVPIHEPDFTILDALSATGLRALRYALEIPFATSITANDLLHSATGQIKLNVIHNKLTSKINIRTGNAVTHMYNLIDPTTSHSNNTKSLKYNVIDLDPYGTAVPFLDAAVQAIQDGGLLCVTCTDAAVWASNGWPEKCFALYGGMPLKGPLSHEAGLRLILHAIATSAARYGLAITPLLSLSIDFYARIFVRVYRSAQHVKFLAGKTMTIYNCDTGCGAWMTQMLGRNRYATTKKGNEMWKHGLEQGPSAKDSCAECGFKTHIGGPMYAGLLHNPKFVKQILDNLKDADSEIYKTLPRIQGMLTVALEECLPPVLPTESLAKLAESENKKTSSIPQQFQALITGPAVIDSSPFFFMLPALSKVVHTVTPHENAIRGALRNLGYRVTRSHTKGGSMKTDAPWSVIWRVMRAWVKEKSPVKEGAIREKTAGWTILGLGLSEEERETRDQKCCSEDGSSVQHSPKIVFDEKLGSEKDRNKLVRYQRNPRDNWGPMSRAKGNKKVEIK